MEHRVRPLVEVVAQIPDHRQARGRRYPLAGVLTLVCAALLCGYSSYSAMAEWGRHYGVELLEAVGITPGRAPCAATLAPRRAEALGSGRTGEGRHAVPLGSADL